MNACVFFFLSLLGKYTSFSSHEGFDRNSGYNVELCKLERCQMFLSL